MITLAPNLIEPCKDELFYSYISRMAAENGLQDIKYFVGKYITNEHDNTKINNIYWNYDGKNLFPAFLNAYPGDSNRFITECSLYPFHAIFLTTYRQVMVVDQLFNTLHVKKPYKSFNLTRELFYCDDCIKEELRTQGYYYLHRSHQLPGVTVCHKHHTPLYRYEDTTQLEPTADAIEYAEFSSALLQANLQTDISQIQLAIERHTVNTGLNYNKIPDIIRALIKFGTIENLKSCLPEDNNTKLKFILSVGDEYDVYEPFGSTIIKMRHKSCGTEFYTTPAGFITGWKCPACYNRADIPTASFKDAVKALVGDEYTVLGEYKGQIQKIEIRHNKCGQIHAFQPINFLRGYRCKSCTSIVPPEHFPKMVEYMTNGQYRVTRILSNDLYEITEAGGQVIELTKSYFLQELRRPTPSNILPVPVKCIKDDWNEQIWDLDAKPSRIQKKDLMEKIRSLYSDNELIFREDLKNKFSENFSSMLDNWTFKLLLKNDLFRVEPGIYTLTKQEIPPERLLKEKYLIRNGHRIGIYESKSLAYEMGLTSKKPDITYIRTNKESSKSHRRVTVNGFKIRLQGNTVIINDDNYKYIMVMEALKYCYHYNITNIHKIPQFIKENHLSLNVFLLLLPTYSNTIQQRFKKMWKGISWEE